MLKRILEPEVMESPDEAADYDAMDHIEVNRLFVDDFIAAGFSGGDVLDIGTGTAQIPIVLCKRIESCRVMAIDMAVSMLEIGRINVAAAHLQDRIQLAKVDAKALPYRDQMFDAVMSNSIVHHIPEPEHVLREAKRVTKSGGLVFFRDLLRPESADHLDGLVKQHAGNESEHGRLMFAASLHAALSLDEVRAIVEEIGCNPDQVQQTTDRHWTWASKISR